MKLFIILLNLGIPHIDTFQLQAIAANLQKITELIFILHGTVELTKV